MFPASHAKRGRQGLAVSENIMQINITGRHIEVSHSIKDYIMKKLSKLQKYTNKIIDIKVILDIQGFRHITELILTMKSRNMVVKEEGESLSEAFDIALDKMQKRVRRYWERRKRHDRR